MTTVACEIGRTETLLETVPQEVVRRYKRKQGVSGKLAAFHHVELIKFLLACSEMDFELVPSEVVDEAWHNFILFTQEYGNWCEVNLGKMIHHVPADGDVVDVDSYVRTVELLRDRYEADETLWPIGAAGANCGRCQNCGGNCGQGCAPPKVGPKPQMT